MALALAGGLLSPLVKQNYDLSVYLSKDTETRKALDAMKKEFGLSTNVLLVKKDVSISEAKRLKSELENIEGVQLVSFDESEGYVEGNALFAITLSGNEYSATAKAAVKSIREHMSGDYLLSGAVVNGEQLSKALAREMPIIMIIALIVVCGVLLLTSHSFIEPVIFGVVIATAILINMGSNLIFGSISYITKAVAAILQLALAMDYSIMLLHSYSRFLEEGLAEKEAVERALASSFRSIFSSALTTVAGLVALMFMSFTIGFDIGIVLAKGIIISMLTVFCMMPALILILKKPLKKTRHQPVKLGGAALGRLSLKTKTVLPIVMAVVIIAAAVVQTTNSYSFTNFNTSSKEAEIEATFGANNQIVVLMPLRYAADADTGAAFERAVKAYELNDKPVVKDIKAYATLTLSAAELAAQLNAEPETVASLIAALGFSEPIAVNKLYDALAPYESVGDIKVTAAFVAAFGLDKTAAQTLLYLVYGNYGDYRLVSVAKYLIAHQDILTSAVGESQAAQITKVLNEVLDGSLSEAVYAALDTLYATFNGKEYSRILISTDLEKESKETFGFIEFLKARADESFGNGNLLCGESISTYDISSAFTGDLLKTNLITIIAILLIVGFTFMSLSMPVILVLIIKGAIWIALAVYALIGNPIFFMSYIICSAIMMGATIDYGILLSNQYIVYRRQMDKGKAVQMALTSAMPTIFTSGVILIVAGFTIGFVSTVMPIFSIGRLLGLGTIVSVLLVLFLLPPLLLLCDKLITKTSLKRK